MGLLPASADSREAIERELSRLRNALVRWQLELGRGDMTEELHRWEPLLVGAAINHFEARGKDDPDGSEKALSILGNAIAALSGMAINWQDADELSRARLVEISEEERGRGSEALEEMLGVKVGL